MITTLLFSVALTTLDADLRTLAVIAGEPSRISAAGITHDETPILTIENDGAFDPASTKRRLVLVGGLDGDARSVDAVVAAVRWFKTRASAAMRREWTISALPSAHFESTDKQSLVRWITFQAPDLVVTIGGAWDAVKGVPYRNVSASDITAALPKLLASKIERSALHDEIVARVQREPLAIARVLARRYPETPSISYIPAVAWTQTLRLAAVTNDDSLREKVRQQIQPWMSGEKKLFGDRIQLTSVAGTMIFAELAAAGDKTALALAEEAVPLAAARKPSGIAEYSQGWTDDMFMATSVLARASLRPNHRGEIDNAARLLIDYTARLQQPSGLFNHASDAPAAWGRGNGFAALGLIETLEAMSVMPAPHASRAKLLDIYRRQMDAVRAQQAPDGMWRQIIDAPGAYREETATAMLMTAMARGIRVGWLDRSYLPVVQRAWRALAAHVVEDGTLVDVCASTGGGTTRRYYFDRPAVTGADDRGGAMALLAAMELHELAKSGQSARQ
jgi:rhamnogalacturonyl hydrolase YesR